MFSFHKVSLLDPGLSLCYRSRWCIYNSLRVFLFGVLGLSFDQPDLECPLLVFNDMAGVDQLGVGNLHDRFLHLTRMSTSVLWVGFSFCFSLRRGIIEEQNEHNHLHILQKNQSISSACATRGHFWSSTPQATASHFLLILIPHPFVQFTP